MKFFITVLFLTINSVTPATVSPNATQGTAQNGTKPPQTTLPVQAATKITTKPPQTTSKVTGQSSTTKAPQTSSSASAATTVTTKPSTPKDGSDAAEIATKPVASVVAEKVEVKVATPIPPTTAKPGPALTTNIKLIQPEVTRLVYITKKPTTQKAGVAKATTVSPIEETAIVKVEVVQEAITEIVYGSTEAPDIDGFQCPPDYHLINLHCYYFSHQKVSWDVSVEECEKGGGQLAVIKNPPVFQESIAQKDGNESIFWVGGVNTNGSWNWIDGLSIDSTFPWGLMKPLNASEDRSCMMLNQQMGVYLVNHKPGEAGAPNNLTDLANNHTEDDDPTVKLAGGGFTNGNCDKPRRYICDAPIQNLGCIPLMDKNPEQSGLATIEQLIISNTRRAPKYPAKCPKNFQNVSGMCIYFSEVKKCWEDAATFCKNLRIGTAREVTLAVLTDDVAQNHVLLHELAARGSSVWLGGFRDQQSMNHLWVDGRLINLGECHWNETEPDHSGNCISAEIKKLPETRRTYLYDEDCAVKKHFVCRATCPDGFEEYGDSCYSFSTESVPWKTAETRCQDLSIGLNQNVHLATFGVDTEDDMNLLAEIAFEEKGHQHCSCGILIGHQCMHIQSEKMDWDSARKTCEDTGMILAEPVIPEALASYMQNNSMTGEYHLGGHYMNGRMVWLHQNEPSEIDHLFGWVKGFPGNNLSADSTLAMTLEINGPLYVQARSIQAKFICEQKNNFWVGGSRTYFKDWVWTNGKQVDLNSPYFANKEPRLHKDFNCLIAERSITPNKAFLKSDSCANQNRYICQASDINPFGKEFIQIGDGYYYISTMNNHSHTTWQEARDICQGLEVPEMYTVDLAVLNRQDQRDSAFELDFLSMNKGFSLWIGARAVTNNDVTNWVWVNTQPQHEEVLQPESIYWSLDLDTTPIEGAKVYLTWDKWETSIEDVKRAFATNKESVIAKSFQGFRKPVLYWEQSDSTTQRAFVCQVFDKV